MRMFIVLGKPDCPFCDRVKKMIDSKGDTYLYIDITTDPTETTKQWLKGNGQTTVPQVFELLPGGFEGLRTDYTMAEVSGV